MSNIRDFFSKTSGSASTSAPTRSDNEPSTIGTAPKRVLSDAITPVIPFAQPQRFAVYDELQKSIMQQLSSSAQKKLKVTSSGSQGGGGDGDTSNNADDNDDKEVSYVSDKEEENEKEQEEEKAQEDESFHGINEEKSSEETVTPQNAAVDQEDVVSSFHCQLLFQCLSTRFIQLDNSSNAISRSYDPVRYTVKMRRLYCDIAKEAHAVVVDQSFDITINGASMYCARCHNRTKSFPVINPYAKKELFQIPERERLIKSNDQLPYFHSNFAAVMIGGKCCVADFNYTDDFKQQHIDFIHVSEFFLYHANKTIRNSGGSSSGSSNVDPRLQEQVARIWWNHADRMSYRGIRFAPEHGLERALHINGEKYLNLWHGFAVDAVPGDISQRLQYIKEVISDNCEDRFEYLLNWLAYAVQKPALRPGTAIVLQGQEGIGKTSLYDCILKPIFGRHAKLLSHAKHLVGNFNGHMAEALLLFADESFWAGDKASEGVLKSVITSEELTIEWKSKDAIQMRNFVHLLMSTNNDWAVPASSTARRFACYAVSESKRGDDGYFAALREECAKHKGAFLHFLQQRNIQDFRPNILPQSSNEALWQNQLFSMSPVLKWWYNLLQLDEYDLLKRFGNEKARLLFKDSLWNNFTETTTNQRRYNSSSDMFKELHRVLPTESRTPAKGQDPFCPGQRKNAMRFNLISCRQTFAAEYKVECILAFNGGADNGHQHTEQGEG